MGLAKRKMEGIRRVKGKRGVNLRKKASIRKSENQPKSKERGVIRRGRMATGKMTQF